MNSTIFFAVIVAAALHAYWNLVVKRTGTNSIATLWVAQLSVGAILWPLAVWQTGGSAFTTTSLIYIAVSGTIHGLYIVLLGWAYRLGDFSVVYPIVRGVGVAGTAITATLLGVDHLSPVGVAGIAAVISGTYFIGSREHEQPQKRAAFLMAIVVGVSVAAYLVTDKLAMQHIDPILFVTSINLASPIVVAPFVLTRFRGDVADVLRRGKLVALFVGIVSIAGYGIILWAFQTVQASYVSALRESSVVAAALLGFWVLKETATRRKVWGIAFILTGAVLLKTA